MVYLNAKKFLFSAPADTVSTERRMSELLEKAGNPHRRLRYLRLAGSNGKTVLAEMLMSITKDAGYTAGCLRMPMRDEPCENVCIGSQALPTDVFADYTEHLKELIPSLSFAPTASELLLVLALTAFEKAGCDICIIESNHFGDDPSRFLPPPFAAVICGTIPNDSTAEISRIRSYICKGITEIVSAPQNSEAYKIISSACYSINCRLTLPSKNSIAVNRLSLGGTEFTYERNRYSLGLCGRFQVSNAVLVLETVKMLVRRGYKIDADTVASALAKIRIPAKFEVISLSPLIIADSTHTPIAIETVCDALADFKQLTGRRVRLCLPQGDIIGNYVGALSSRGYEIEKIISEQADLSSPAGEGTELYKNKPQLARAALKSLDKDTVLLISGDYSFVTPVRHSLLELMYF